MSPQRRARSSGSRPETSSKTRGGPAGERVPDHGAPGPRLGAHMSIGGGLYRALERGRAADCDVVQVFTRSNQQWAVRPIPPDDLARWEEARRRTGVVPTSVHASYLINLASPERALWERSLQALQVELERCALLGIPFLVLHPGSHMGDGEAAGLERIARACRQVLEGAPPGVGLLLENMAGQGSSLGHRFEHLRDLLDGAGALDPARLGVCFDTCHTLAAGYGLETAAGWDATIEELDRVVGLRWVGAVHVNDSKGPRGCRVDRHEHVGRGELGLETFRRLINDPRLGHLPMTLETPKPTPHADAINVAVLRALVGRARVGPRARQLAAQALAQPLRSAGDAESTSTPKASRPPNR